MPDREKLIASLCPSFHLDLDCFDFQLLWLVPIIEVIWADGRCQREEAEILLRYADQFVHLVEADVPEITSGRVRRFLQPFFDASVGRNPRKRSELARFSHYIANELVAPAHPDKRRHLFDICIEVATAARTMEGVQPGRRISFQEERLLKELLRDLRLDQ